MTINILFRNIGLRVDSLLTTILAVYQNLIFSSNCKEGFFKEKKSFFIFMLRVYAFHFSTTFNVDVGTLSALD
jgi:hypothetical protein